MLKGKQTWEEKGQLHVLNQGIKANNYNHVDMVKIKVLDC